MIAATVPEGVVMLRCINDDDLFPILNEGWIYVGMPLPMRCVQVYTEAHGWIVVGRDRFEDE
jgi:hypothetical protein